MKGNKLTLFSRLLALLGAVALLVAIFVPLWRIELDAPQYPEGLALLIYPHKLGGDVEIINGLNHYIGMQTLHAENFVEFTVLPYIIGFFALLFLSVAIISKRRWLNVVFFTFVFFGIIAMVDFWRWEYNYGHELDPNAAIKVPGMAYQPPLIGFKQLLNFGAYSIPDTGGWMFIAAGIFLLLAVLAEGGYLKKLGVRKNAVVILFFSALGFASCNSGGPEPIAFNSDKCAHCRMTISDARYAAELQTVKGRINKFDDVVCMTRYLRENQSAPAKKLWVSQYDGNHSLIDANEAFFVKLETLNSPMRGNMAAFADKRSAAELLNTSGAELVDWNELVKEP
ncbi:MAG TPA: nitrous oxide reductase accessory protein NosL [Phnomibacter sp.]|nr:nitrous oxide reductase accessory protein NosL [Phnomibacter sp.]